MNSWAVLEPPPAPPGKTDAANRVVFIKDGWSLPALIFGALWLLWKRQWLLFLGWLAASAAIAFTASTHGLDQIPATVFSWLFGLWLALEGNALQAANLQRKGWRLSAVVRGHKLLEAEMRYFHARSASFIRQPDSDRPGVSRSALHVPAGDAGVAAQRTVSPWGARGTDPDVLGLFPEPQEPKS